MMRSNKYLLTDFCGNFFQVTRDEFYDSVHTYEITDVLQSRWTHKVYYMQHDVILGYIEQEVF